MYDIIIVGGGMVGGTLACALAAQDLRVAIVEARDRREWEPTGAGDFDLRVSAITRASQAIFERLGVWQAMAARRVSPFREMRVWDGTGNGSIHFDSAEIGEPMLGHIIENRVMVAALEERLAGLPSVTWHRPENPVGLRREAHAMVLDLEAARLAGAMLVGADGARSRVRDLAGIGCNVVEYGQQAVVATVKTERWHEETAWQRFLPAGPLAFLPLPDGYSSIVWTTGPEQAQGLVALDQEAFCETLEVAFGSRLGRVLWAGPRATFPLRRQHADAYVQPRLALVGDAAHTIHPLAGQGVNLGLLDAAALAQVVSEAVGAGKDPGELAVLRRYERWRRGQNLGMQALMGGFKHLFGSSLAPARLVRNLGLSLTNAAGPVKHAIVRRAIGLEGDLPELARSAVRSA